MLLQSGGKTVSDTARVGGLVKSVASTTERFGSEFELRWRDVGPLSTPCHEHVHVRTFIIPPNHVHGS